MDDGLICLSGMCMQCYACSFIQLNFEDEAIHCIYIGNLNFNIMKNRECAQSANTLHLYLSSRPNKSDYPWHLTTYMQT